MVNYYEKTLRHICFTAIYFTLVTVSIFYIDFLFGISIKTAVKAGVAAALLYLGFIRFCFIKRRYYQKDKKIAEKRDIYIMRNKNHRVPIASRILVCIILCGICSLYEKNMTDTPRSLKEFGIKYPEANEFVVNYPKYKNMSFDKDFRLEVIKREFPLFIQWDKRWGYQYYYDDLLGTTGCGPTCISMVLCGLMGSDEWNPYRVAQFSMENGYYVQGEGTSWALMTYGAKQPICKPSRRKRRSKNEPVLMVYRIRKKEPIKDE